MKMLFRSLLALTLTAALFSSCTKWIQEQKKRSITLDPDHNVSEVHIFGNDNLDQTFPDATEIAGGAGTYNGDPTWIRAALKFDLSSIPEDASIVSAKLTLYSNPTPLNGHNGEANSGPDNALLIQRITSDWIASEVKWLNQPTATTDDQVVVPHTNQPFKDISKLDVTDLVKQMRVANYGFFIRLQTEQAYNFRIFCSSKYSDKSKHPKLEVTYRKN